VCEPTGSSNSQERTDGSSFATGWCSPFGIADVVCGVLLLDSCCRSVHFAGTSRGSNFDVARWVLKADLRRWCIYLVAGVLESEEMGRGLVPVLGTSNINLTGSGSNLRGLEGKSRALLVELSLVEPVGKGGTGECESGTSVSSVEGTCAEREGSLRTLNAERWLGCLHLVSDSSSSVREGT